MISIFGFGNNLAQINAKKSFPPFLGVATLGRVAGAEGWRRVRVGRVPGFGALCASDFSVTLVRFGSMYTHVGAGGGHPC